MKPAYFIILAFLLAMPFVLAQETGTQPAADAAAQTAAQLSAEPSATTQPAAEIPATDSAQQSSSSTTQPASDQTAIQPSTQSEQQPTDLQPPPAQDPLVQQPIQQPAAQPCDQVQTLAADGAGNCKEFSNSCLPPGWYPVDKCPERSALQQPAVQPISNPMPAGQGGSMQPGVQVPSGCREVKEDTGFVRVVCEAQQQAPCPQYSDADAEKCKSRNGRPDYFQDQRGCKIFECVFQESAGGGFLQPIKCPSEEERQAVSEKCKSSDMNPVTRKDYNGCMFVDCVGSGNMPGAACPSENELQKNIDACKSKGGRWISEFDRSGCKVVNCNLGNSAGSSCKYVPQEAFESCRSEGGEMVVKDDKGCITYANCVKRGDENSVAYEQVDDVPQASTLLSLAFKLEQLKIEFDKLSKQTDQIADYYASTGNRNEEERFRKVSSMFLGSNGKIDEIKTKMRGRMSSLTKDDIAEFKHDVKYIRDVVIQDILYVMLSTEGASAAGPSQAVANAGAQGCGNDGECFSKALRTCEKTKFYPEGSKGTEVSIEGLEDKNCIIKVMQKNPDGNAYDMTCKYPNYVMGMGKPEELLPYCEGSMVEAVKQNPPKKIQTNENTNEGMAPQQGRQPGASASGSDAGMQNPGPAPQQMVRKVERIPMQ